MINLFLISYYELKSIDLMLLLNPKSNDLQMFSPFYYSRKVSQLIQSIKDPSASRID
jgi:hypothetical protein